jgi:hypothetical protein
VTRLKTRSVTRVRSTPGGWDADGDPITSTTADEDIEGVLLAPRTDLVSLGETTERARNGVVVGYTAYFPPGTDVTRHDQFRIDGDLWDVTGEPGPWIGHQVGGIEVALRRAEG